MANRVVSYLASNAWPELYGFQIYGDGPSYVILVEQGSIADSAGLRVGDRIIELDNIDVSKQSASIIKQIATKSKNIPPPISVQSFCQQADLISSRSFSGANKTNEFGLTVRDHIPIIVDHVVDNSPAYMAGLRAGDVIVEVNQKQLKVSHQLKQMLNEASMINLKYVPISRENINLMYQKSFLAQPALTTELNLTEKIGSNELTEEWTDDKLKRAKEFYATLNQVFLNDPDKRKCIINELKHFTERGDMYKLTDNLNKILRSLQQRVLLERIKPFIPIRQQALFEHLTSQISSSINLNLKNVSEKVENFDKIAAPSPYNNCSMIKSLENDLNANLSTNKVKVINRIPNGVREVAMKKNKNDSFGFTFSVHKFILVDLVETGSIAELAGLHANDIILSVNNINVNSGNIDYLAETLKRPRQNLVLEVVQKSDYDLQKMSKIKSSTMEGLSLKNNEGKSFKEKVKEVLNSQEKAAVKKTLLEYNKTKNIHEFMAKMHKILDTSAQKSIWFYLLPIIEDDHEDVAYQFFKTNSIDVFCDYSTTGTNLVNAPRKRSKLSNFGKSGSTNNMYDENDENEYRYISRRSWSEYFPILKRSKQFNSTPNLSNKNLIDNDNELVLKFIKQLDYLLNAKERNQVKFALKDYNGDRNINKFVEEIDKILDTPAKQTLWFHVIPLLDEYDQEYSKRRLCLMQSRESLLTEHQANYNEIFSYDTNSSRQYTRGESDYLTDNEIDTLFDFPIDREESNFKNVSIQSPINEEKIDRFKKSIPNAKESASYQPRPSNMTSSFIVDDYIDPKTGKYRYLNKKTSTLEQEQHFYEYETRNIADKSLRTSVGFGRSSPMPRESKKKGSAQNLTEVKVKVIPKKTSNLPATDHVDVDTNENNKKGGNGVETSGND